MKGLQFGLQAIFCVTGGIAVSLAIGRSGSIAAFFSLLYITTAAVLTASKWAVDSFPVVRPFYAGFALAGWTGLLATMTAAVEHHPRLTILESIDSHLWRSDASHFDRFSSSTYGIEYLTVTLACAVAVGLLAYAMHATFVKFRGSGR